MHQRKSSEETQRQHALRRRHVDVDDVIRAGRRDDNSQVGGRRRGVLRLLVDVVRRRRVSAVPPDLTAQGLYILIMVKKQEKKVQ